MSSLKELVEKEELLKIEKALTIDKLLSGNSAKEILEAKKYLGDVEQRKLNNSRSLILDPMQLTQSMGFRDKPYSLSYDVLRGMGKVHIVRAIFETRKDQIKSFCVSQDNKYAAGFVIEKVRTYSQMDEEIKLTKQDRQKIDWITQFILDCGTAGNMFHRDTFDVFVGKLMDDSLTLDQGTFENVRNRRGELVEFYATDGASYRLADTHFDDEKTISDKSLLLNGYPPSYVQVYQNRPIHHFYPWELGFCVRNPKTDIKQAGYGRAEMEDMIQTITAILNSDFYNANFFRVGSSPKGILRYSGNINPNTLDELKQSWQSQVAGVLNHHKMPMINADKLEFINTHVPNKDMEWSKYLEFLIKICCAIWKIDPSEIGFPMSGASDSKPMFEGSNEAKLKYSRDKGLQPLLRQLEWWINKWIVSQIDPSFRFKFVGIGGDEDMELDRMIKRLSNTDTVDEIRVEQGKKPLGPERGGDAILSPPWIQWMGMKQQQEQMAQQQMGGDEEGDENQSPFLDQEEEDSVEENPFMKSLSGDLERILNS